MNLCLFLAYFIHIFFIHIDADSESKTHTYTPRNTYIKTFDLWKDDYEDH